MFKQSEEQFKEPPDKPLEYRTIALDINPAAVFIKQQIKFWHLIIADFRTKSQFLAQQKFKLMIGHKIWSN